MVSETTRNVLIGIAVLVIIAIIAAVGIVGWYISTQQMLVDKDTITEKAKAEVQSQYQRRADLIPNLVATVQGSAKFEKSTYVEIAAMRSQAGMVQQQMKQATSIEEMQQIDQNSIGSVLARLMVVYENYPELKTTEQFTTLQSQIEGSENRVNYARDNYNEAVRDYKSTVSKIPVSFVASGMGYTVDKWKMFEAKASAQDAPVVNFSV